MTRPAARDPPSGSAGARCNASPAARVSCCAAGPGAQRTTRRAGGRAHDATVDPRAGWRRRLGGGSGAASLRRLGGGAAPARDPRAGWRAAARLRLRTRGPGGGSGSAAARGPHRSGGGSRGTWRRCRDQPTCTATAWYPRAPSGGGGVACAVWTSPVPSVARTVKVWRPGPSCAESRHWTQVCGPIAAAQGRRLPVAVVDLDLHLGHAAVRRPRDARDLDRVARLELRVRAGHVDPRLGQDRAPPWPSRAAPSRRRTPRAS